MLTGAVEEAISVMGRGSGRLESGTFEYVRPTRLSALLLLLCPNKLNLFTLPPLSPRVELAAECPSSSGTLLFLLKTSPTFPSLSFSLISSSFLPTADDDPDANELPDAEGVKERRELALERAVRRDDEMLVLGAIP